MTRYVRNTAILCKIETTSGVDSVPTGAANAMLVSDLSITPLEAQNVDRDLIRGYFGASEQLVATAFVRCSFTVELAGSGTAGTAPAWGAALRACAVAEATLATPPRVEYTPVSTALSTVTIYWYDDGVLHRVFGAMGNVRLEALVGDRPKLIFEFTGVDGGVSAAANPALTLTAFRTPPTMARANVVDVSMGGTYATGAVTGGTQYNSSGIALDFGNQVSFTPLLNEERIDLTQRSITGRVALDLSPAEEVTLMASVKANTLQSMSMRVGTVAGNSIIIFMPRVQLINPRKEEINGARMIGFDTRLVPNVGNDEIRLAHI